MNKKISSLLLAFVMVLSFVTVSQAAGEPVVENFDDEAVGIIANGVTYRGESEIFGDGFFLTTATAEISADGFSGNCFKVIEQGGDWYQLGTENFVATDTEPVYVNFKLRVDNDADGTAAFPIRVGYDNYLYIQRNGSTGVNSIFFAQNGSGHLPYEVGSWYDFTFKFTVGRVYATIQDEYGNKITGYRDTSYKFLDFKGAGSQSATIAGTGISLDEFFVAYGDEYAVGLNEDSLPENLQSISRMPQIDFAFNAPASLDNMMVGITDSLGDPVLSTDYTVTPKLGIGATLEFNVMLPKAETYTVTVSGVENLAGASQDDITFGFTTEFAHILTVENKSKSDLDEKTQVDIIFSNTLGYPAIPVKVMGIVYENGEMTSLEYKAAEVDENGTLTLVFDTITSAQDLTVLVFDDSETLIPVTEAISFR